ncbi:MAG TPA: hypothetical protein DCP69_02310 [Candidatus Omnitrophica bacterium]|nr:hypothetical protein [Candidatus Omnitrophota bacterium]
MSEAKKRLRVTPPKIKFQAYNLMERAVSEGVAYGVRHAHKHTEKPGHEIIIERVTSAVMSSLGEIMDFDA